MYILIFGTYTAFPHQSFLFVYVYNQLNYKYSSLSEMSNCIAHTIDTVFEYDDELYGY